MEKEYLLSENEVLQHLGASPEGLSEAEAKERLAKYGANELKAEPKKSFAQRFAEQLKDPMLIILMAPCSSRTVSIRPSITAFTKSTST